MGVIIFNGISSLDYGIQVETPPGYQTPARDYEVVHIPGRNGDLVIDNGSYQNVTRSYDIAVGDCKKDFPTMANYISSWLNSANGYARLEDSYEPDYYRMAMFQNEIDIENILNHAGRTTIEFNCKPQRFLKSGEIPLYLEREENPPPYSYWFSNLSTNPTNQISYPLIKISGSGGPINLRFYDKPVVPHSSETGIFEIYISDVQAEGETYGHIIIDCEMKEAYEIASDGSIINRNEDIIVESRLNGVPGTTFPYLFKDKTYVVVTYDDYLSHSDITSVEVIPRWWTL